MLEQHITQAIQPVLNEFRQQMAQEITRETGAAPVRAAGGQASGQAAAQQAPAQPSQAQPPLSQALDQHVAERPLAGVTNAVAPVVQTAEQQAAHGLQSILVAGLAALLSESTRAAVQQRGEQGLHTLLEKLFAAVPSSITNQEMREKTERTLQLILRESLDAVFAEGVRRSVQQGGQQTIEQSLHRDFGGALHNVEDTLKVMLAALLSVLRRHQQTLLRLLLALVLLALENSLLEPDKPDKAKPPEKAEKAS
jgi:hypothetical protein